MNTYTVNYNNACGRKIYIIAAENDVEAVAQAIIKETGTDRYGNTSRPDYKEFEVKIINGVYSRKSGVKSVIY